MRVLPRIVAPIVTVTLALLTATACDTRLNVGPGRSQALAVGESGWIVGSYLESSDNIRRSFVIEPDGRVHIILRDAGGTCGGGTELTDINADGTAVGTHVVTTCRQGSIGYAVRWTPAGGLETIAPGGSSADAIADDGAIVGLRFVDGVGVAGVRWTPDLTFEPLPPAGSATDLAQPVDINARGDILGATLAAPFIWQGGTTVVPLATDGLSEAQAYSISDTGQVAGSAVVDGVRRAVVWRSAGEPVVLAGGAGESVAGAVDDAGGVVGSITDEQGVTRPAYWAPSGTVQVLANLGGRSGAAHEIAEDGTIVGYVQLADGRTEAARWDRPDPAT